MNSRSSDLRTMRWAAAVFIVAAGCASPGSRGPYRAAYSAYIRGLMLERTAQLPSALDSYQMALEYDEESPQLHARLGATYVKLGQPERALEEFQKALALDPKHVDALRWVAMLYTSQGRLDEAVVVYERLLEVQPEDRFVISTLADLYVLQGQLSTAVELYRKLIVIHGSSSQLHFNLGVLLGRLGRFEEALVELSRALETAPDSLEIRVALGLTFELSGMPERAAAHYEEVVQMDPFNPRLYHHAARAYANSGQLSQAAVHYQTVLDLVPHDLEAVMGLVKVWMAGNQYDLAEDLLSHKIVELDEPPELYLALGILYREAREAREAVRAFERALELKEEYPQAHFYLAAQLDQLGETDAARARLKRTIELDPVHADALNYLGYLDADAGVNLQQAKTFVERALILDPNNGAYLDSLGWVYYKLGRLEDALEILRRAVERVDSDPVVFDHLGDVYFALGKTDEARKYWKRALELDSEQADIRSKLERTSNQVNVGSP